MCFREFKHFSDRFKFVKFFTRFRRSCGLYNHGKIQVQAVVVLIQYPCPG